jgi:hypothetical protein
MKVRGTRMDMIQYSNIGDYRQTPDAKYHHAEGDKNTSFATKKKISRPKAELSEVDQILLEVELTDYLQNEVDRCNSRLKNFKLRLTMEEE